MQLLQKKAIAATPAPPEISDKDRAQLEIELIENFKGMLGRLFRADKINSTLQRKMSEVNKRFARLFFESELHEKLAGDDNTTRIMRHSEQALYHLLVKAEPALLEDLDAFEYASPDIPKDAKETLTSWIVQLRNEFLAKNTPELNALVKMLNRVLTRFFTQELPPRHGELAWEVVKEAQLGRVHIRAGYKVSAEAFPRFRKAFETRFLQRLVTFAADEMLAQTRASESHFRSETLSFIADPHIYSDICELVCDAVYDYLYNEGFLDLPNDWKNAALSQP